MALISYDKLEKNEFSIFVSANNRVLEINYYQIKLKMNDKHETLTTKFETPDFEDIINKVYLDTKLSKREGYISYIGKRL